VPGPHGEILAILHANIHGVIQPVGAQRIGPVKHVVLVTQLVGDVLERLPHVLGLKRKEGHSAGFFRIAFEDLVTAAAATGGAAGLAATGEEHEQELQKLSVPSYRGRVEHGILIHVEAFDWNCPQHITPRYTVEQIKPTVEKLEARVRELEAQLTELQSV